MSNPNKARGTKFETDVTNYLNGVLGSRTKAYRPAQAGFKDTGDIHGISPFIVQAKAWRDLVSALREGLSGAVLQAGHAGERWGVAVIKRVRKPISESYAVMRLSDWAEFYADYLDLREKARK